MGKEEEEESGEYWYGTFQGVTNFPPQQQTVIGFPHPLPPPAAAAAATTTPSHHHYVGYHSPPTGYDAVAEGTPVRVHCLPCCGIGIGWFLFIIGFFLGAIPWYVGFLLLLCSRSDPREKPGYIACTIAAVLVTVAIILGATRAPHGPPRW